MSQTYTDHNGVTHTDRRQQRHLREVFDGFRAVVAPFVQNDASWGAGNLSYLARRQIQESFPQLDAQEINVLINAVSRVMREERAGVRQVTA